MCAYMFTYTCICVHVTTDVIMQPHFICFPQIILVLAILISIGSCVTLHTPIIECAFVRDTKSPSLLAYKILKFILYIIFPGARISCLFKKPHFLSLENGIRTKMEVTSVFIATDMLLLLGPLS